MYKALITFRDTETNHTYQAGDTYPLPGAKVREDRFAYLSTGNNKTGKPVIEKLPESEEPTHRTRKGRSEKPDEK